MTVGPQTADGGWPILGLDQETLLVVQDEPSARQLCVFINTAANFITHGSLTEGSLAFIIGVDAAWGLEQALQRLGINLTTKHAE